MTFNVLPHAEPKLVEIKKFRFGCQIMIASMNEHHDDGCHDLSHVNV